jgi:O-antigen/teichoic acid export membrane protein
MLVLARLLAPHDFGLVALGSALVAFGAFTADGGIGAALIRRAEPAERADVEALLAAQLTLGVSIAAAVAAAAIWFGETGRVAAVMVITLPLLAVRAPTTILLERQLSYRPLVFAELGETVVYYLWAIPAAAAGLGVWALATAAVARALAGSVLMLRASPLERLRPRPSWSRTRRLLGFGARYQAVGVVNLVRDQGLNIGIAIVGGITLLGIWNLANRILQLPYILFTAGWRVSFPAMARLVAAGDDARPTLERAIRLAAVATGVVVAPLAGCAAALVPAVFGQRWNAVASVLPWPALALMIGGPTSVATGGYLYAIGDARTPLRAAILHTAAWLAIGIGLMPVLGITAAGLGWAAASVIDGFVLGSAATRASGARLWPALVRPLAAACAGAGCGWLVCRALGGFSGGVLAAAVSVLVYGVALLALRRELVWDMVGVTRAAVRLSVARA